MDQINQSAPEIQQASAREPTAPQTTTVGSQGPNLYEHDRALRKWRLYIRIATAVAIALSLILCIAGGARGGNNSHRESDCPYSRYRGRSSCHYSYDINTYDVVSLPILGLVMLWNIAEFITYCVNKRGAHPGVHVGLDLVAWICLFWGGIFAVLRMGVFYNRPSGREITVAAGAFELLACVLHFVLFVMACVATHRRRRLMRSHLYNLHSRVPAPQAVYTNSGYYPPPPPGMAYLVPTGAKSQYHELEQQGARPQSSVPIQGQAVSPTISSSGPSTQPSAPFHTERYA